MIKHRALHRAVTAVQHEATWFSASDRLLSGGGILQLQSERIFFWKYFALDCHSSLSRTSVSALSTRGSPDRCAT